MMMVAISLNVIVGMATMMMMKKMVMMVTMM